MHPSDFQYENTRRAISVMRAWASEGDSIDLAMHEALNVIEADGEETKLMIGLINLAGYLLVLLENYDRNIHEVLDYISKKTEPPRFKHEP